ncbi:hypothetical protein IAQ61_009820 [Plenodomus lingam]|nr:hypothetical protein IAQ61_009820 [Plenodomus lingam]
MPLATQLRQPSSTTKRPAVGTVAAYVGTSLFASCFNARFPTSTGTPFLQSILMTLSVVSGLRSGSILGTKDLEV